MSITAEEAVAVYTGGGEHLSLDALSRTRGLCVAETSEAWTAALRECPAVVTALDPTERRTIAEQIRAGGGRFAELSTVGPAISRRTSFGVGTLIASGAIYVGSTTVVGCHTIVMTPASIGHDVVIGDFVTIYPSVAVSGYVVIEDDVVLGTGAVITNGRPDRLLHIGRGARIAPGAVITTPVRADAVMSGNPARPLR